MINIVIGLLSVILVVVCLLIVLLVMMQRPKQEGLGAAFGGGVTDQMFGAQTTNVLQKGTVYLAVMFFGITLLLSVLVARKQNRSAALGTNLADQAETGAPEPVPPGTADTGAQLLSELPLVPEAGTPAVPPVSEGIPAVEGTTPAPTEGSATLPAGDTPAEVPDELEATPAEPAPSIIDDSAPLPDDPAAPPTQADPEASDATSAPEEPVENADSDGETPNS